MADTHTVMPKKLAQALMEAGMQHFDFGGSVNGTPMLSYVGPGAGATPGGMSMAGGSQNAMPKNPGGGDIFGGGDGPPKIMGMSPISNFQATMPELSYQNFQPQITQQQGNQADVYNQQKNLAQMLLAQTQGAGPGQQLLAQQAGNNSQQQAALMASQRGASANPALVARQAAMAGAQSNQQLLNSQAGLQLQSQGNLAQQQAAMANQALQAQAILQGAQAAQNQAINTASLGVQDINAKTQESNAKATQSIFGGMTSGGGSALASLLAKGGTVPQMLAGGNVPGKAMVKGDSEKNDVVPTMLSPGEDVIPRSITQLPEKEMEQKAIEFLRHLHKNKKGYGAIVKARGKKE